MSIFNQNRADENKAHHILESIENRSVFSQNGNRTTLIWRVPYLDFNTNSVLTVNPGENAIFIKNGQFIAKFDPGRYELKTENYPFLSTLRNLLSGGDSTFTCQIYFIRTAISAEILWGTNSPIQLRDPVQMIATSIRARGAYKVTIFDPFLFITKLSGEIVSFDNEQLDDFFHNEFQQKIKTLIANQLSQAKEEFLGICTKLEEFANLITPQLSAVLEPYGITLNTFSISAMEIPEDDPNRQILEQAYAKKREMNIFGNDYQTIKGMEILRDMANNQSGIAGLGAGIGAGVGAASAISELSRNIFHPNPTPPQPSQPLQQPQPAQDTAAPQAEEDPVVKLTKLKKLLEQGLIDQDEYNEVKKNILAKMC